MKYKTNPGVQSQPKLQGTSNGVRMNPLQVGLGRAKNAIVGAVKGVAHGAADFLNDSNVVANNLNKGFKLPSHKSKMKNVKSTKGTKGKKHKKTAKHKSKPKHKKMCKSHNMVNCPACL